MKVFDQIVDQARLSPRHVVLMEGEDERVLEAAGRIVDEGIARVSVVGAAEPVRTRLAELGVDPAKVNVVDPSDDALASRLGSRLLELRKHKGMTAEEAERLARQPLYASLLMVAGGEADGCVGGAVHATADVVRAALQVIGVAKDAELVSSFFLMLLCEEFHQRKGGALFADCGLVVDPNAEQLAEIAITTAATARRLLHEEPRVAMLSFSTRGSASHPVLDKQARALEIIKERAPDLAVEGEMQFDAAFVPDVGNKKAPGSAVAGTANVLIFPDLEAGNIGYKIAERIGRAGAIGPVLQGLAKPVNDLSRGCSVQDIVRVAAITCVQAQQRTEVGAA